jgi:putative transposase
MIAQARREHPQLSARCLCELLGVARSWYYERPTSPTQNERDVALRDAIEQIVLEFPGYGYRRVTKALERAGWVVNHKRVLRVMRQESLLCQIKQRFVATTDSGHALRTYPNLVAEFAPMAPDQVWVADITYIRLPTAFAFLACVLDAWSRRCVGWHLSRTIDTRLTLAALDHALVQRQPAPGLIHHSDRGIQYTSGDYVARLGRVRKRADRVRVVAWIACSEWSYGVAGSSVTSGSCTGTPSLQTPRKRCSGVSPNASPHHWSAKAQAIRASSHFQVPYQSRASTAVPSPVAGWAWSATRGGSP